MCDDGWEQIDRDLRFGARACGIGLVLAYVLTFPMKWAELMPDHVTWLKLAVGPAAVLGLLGSLFAGFLWLRRRWWLVFFPTALLCWGAMLGLTLWERGW